MHQFVPQQSSYRFESSGAEPMLLADIEPPCRRAGYEFDANGFHHDRMVRVLTGIRDKVVLPPIDVEVGDPGEQRYRVRGGVHRYYASVRLGFTRIPADIVPRY